MADTQITAVLRLKDELSRQIQETNKRLNTLNKSVEKQQKGLDRIGKNTSFTRLAGTIMAAQAAMRTIQAVTTGALNAQAQQIEAVNSLNLALGNQGNLLPGTSERLQEYASALQRTTTYGDELILKNQALLASFGMNEDQLKTTTEVALDFASATGRDLTQAVNLLGKAFVGETGELSRYGIVIDKNTPKSEKFNAVIEQMTQRFGGAAQAATKSFTGQMAQLENATGDTQEALGKFIGELANLGGSTQGTIGVFEWLTELFGKKMVIALGEARAIWSELAATVLNAIASMIEHMAKLPQFIADIYRKFEDLPIIGKIAGEIADKLEVLPNAGLEIAEGMRDMAGGLEEAAKGFREESTAAALAVGDTTNFSKVQEEAATALAAKTQAEQDALAAAHALVSAEMAVTQGMRDQTQAVNDAYEAMRLQVEAARQVEEGQRILAGILEEADLAERQAAEGARVLDMVLQDVGTTATTESTTMQTAFGTLATAVGGDVGTMIGRLGDFGLKLGGTVTASGDTKTKIISAFGGLAQGIGGKVGEIEGHMESLIQAVKGAETATGASTAAMALGWVGLGTTIAGLVVQYREAIFNGLLPPLEEFARRALEIANADVNIDVSVNTSSNSPSPNLPDIALPFQHGGFIPANPPRGTLIRVAEREGEWITPESRASRGQIGPGVAPAVEPKIEVHVHIEGDIITGDDHQLAERLAGPIGYALEKNVGGAGSRAKRGYDEVM